MRLRDLVFLVGSNLRRMKIRLALTSLGVVIGTSAIVLMISLGFGLQNNITAELGSIGPATNITVMGGMMPDPGASSGDSPPPLNERTLAEFEGIEHVETVVPLVMLQTLQGVEYKGYSGGLNVQGLRMDDLKPLGYELKDGRIPRSEDEMLLGAEAGAGLPLKNGREGAGLKSADLMGKKLIATFFEPTPVSQDPEVVAQEPAVFKRRMTVVGVLAKVDPQTDQSSFFTLDSALALNGVPRRKIAYDQVIVKVDSATQVAGVEKTLTDQGYQTMSARSIQKGLKSTFLIIQGVLGALGGIAMLVASLGIANTMTMSIFERTREIGIMKALGASNRQIKRVFLSEAAIIGVIGGVGGLVVSVSGAGLANLFANGYIASQAVASGSVMHKSTSFFAISPGLALFAIAFAAGVGLTAGVLPAVRAANLDPLAALRHE